MTQGFDLPPRGLRPATPADFPFIHSVAGRPDYAPFVIDEPDQALLGFIESPDSALVIWEPEGTPQGFALYCELSNPANRAELRRLALSRPGGGAGLRFVTALRDHSFDALGVDRLWLDVATDNARARKTYERAGFVYEGTLRQHWRRPAGDIVGLDLLAMLRAEWTGPETAP